MTEGGWQDLLMAGGWQGWFFDKGGRKKESEEEEEEEKEKEGEEEEGEEEEGEEGKEEEVQCGAEGEYSQSQVFEGISRDLSILKKFCGSYTVLQGPQSTYEGVRDAPVSKDRNGSAPVPARTHTGRKEGRK